MSSRNWLLEPMESRGDQLRKLHRHEASWEGWSEALSLPWQTRCAGQILLVPWFCLSPANTTLWRTLAFHWADHRMLLHRFLPLWNSLRFNFLVLRTGRRALDVNHFEEYLWLKAAAKNDQYKAGLNLTRVMIQLWFACFLSPDLYSILFAGASPPAFQCRELPFPSSEKGLLKMVQMVYDIRKSEPSWACTRRGKWQEGKWQNICLASHCRLRILLQIGFNGAYNVKVGGESLKFRCRTRGEMRKVWRCADVCGLGGNSGTTSTRGCSQFRLVQSWLSFLSISRRKARQCWTVGTSDWQQIEHRM